jgi:hypothetical protein
VYEARDVEALFRVEEAVVLCDRFVVETGVLEDFLIFRYFSLLPRSMLERRLVLHSYESTVK